MTKESLEELNKNELISLLLQWSKVNNLLNTRLNNLEMENISQREEIRSLKNQTNAFGIAGSQYFMDKRVSPTKPHRYLFNKMDLTV